MSAEDTAVWVDGELPTSSSPLATPLSGRISIAVFAFLVALLAVIAAFFTVRNGDIDELMMYNPAYMLAHFGKLTFPTYPYRAFYDSPVVIHPPIHVGLMGLVQRLGFSWYYAEAIPTLLLILFSVAVIVFSIFPAPVKLGLLFSIGFVVSSGEQFVVLFGTRPEGELYAAWFAGLLLLESGRIAGWNRLRLAAGAFMLTWASGLHYYAFLAFAGIAVYLVWAVMERGRTRAEAPCIALIAGGCLFGLPYLWLYVLPHLKDILMYVRLAKADAGVAEAVRIQFRHYHDWASSPNVPALVGRIAGLKIPLLTVSTVVLLVIKSTRGLVLTSLPLQLFVFFFAAHKLPNYLIHEVAIYAVAIAVAVLVLVNWLWQRLLPRWANGLFLPIASAAAVWYLAAGNITLESASLEPFHRVHEAVLARAATRSILGPHARGAGRDGAWYISGADYWFDIERDMLPASPYDPISYFSNFDAVADYPQQSQTTANKTISSWYSDGTLKLRGFFFGETNAQLQIVLLSTRQAAQVLGYVVKRGQLYRFEQHAEGDYQVQVAVCPLTPELRPENWQHRWPETYSTVLYLPNAPGTLRTVATVLVPRHLAEPAGWMQRVCRPVAALNGTLFAVDKQRLLDSLSREDPPMQFPRMLEDLPGYTGVKLPATMIPPQDSIQLDRVIQLNKIQSTTEHANIEHVPQIRLTTPSILGGFAAAIPVNHGDSVTEPCWIQLRLKVLTGEIGFAAYSQKSGIRNRTPLPILKSDQPIDVVLSVPDFRNIDDVIIFNDTALASSQVDVLNASVLVSRDNWKRNQATLSAVK